MPYIERSDRYYLDNSSHTPRTSGELNYEITRLLIKYIQLKGGLSYQNISEALSACHEAEEELRRRVLAPYEDKKIQENGDVYPEDWTK